MQESRVLRFRFERVTDGVAEIQDAAQIAFALIRGNHFGLDAHGVGDDAVDGGGFLREHARRALIEQLE